MGTGTTGWEQGILALLAGSLMLVAQAPKKVPIILLALIAGFVVFTCLSLLPLNWPSRPDWWLRLRGHFDLTLPQSWSAQPYFTIEAGGRALFCLMWLSWWICRLPDYDALRLSTRLLSLGIAGLALAALVFRTLGWEPSLWNHATSEQFGPFGNRNVFSSLMAVGGVLTLATAYDLYRRRHHSWLIHAVAVLPMFLCVLACNSRSGIVMFLVGLALWFATASLRKGVAQRVSIVGSLLLAATAGVVILGRPLYDRFFPEDKSLASLVAEDGRTPIFSETLRIVSESPGLGYGLGNFEPVFAMMHEMDDPNTTIVHPESDWLWMLMESGVIVTTLMFLLAGVMVRWSMPKRWRTDDERRGERRLHMAAAIACLTLALQTLVHPPLHVLPVFMTLAMVCGLSVRRERFRNNRGVPGALIFRTSGAFSLLAGGLWISAQLGQSLLFGETAYMAQTNAAREAIQAERPVAALAAAEKAVAAAPLGWEGYFERASARLLAGQTSSAASADFAIARYLQPKLTALPLDEADVWLRYDPSRAISAWREAMQRDPTRRAWRYSEALSNLPVYPELREGIRALATTPDLLVQYLSHQAGDTAEVQSTLGLILNQYPSLAPFPSVDRRRILSLWHAYGDKTALMKLIRSDPGFHHDGWIYLASELAETGRYQEAYEMALKQVGTPPLAVAAVTTSGAQLERDFAFSPNDPRRGLALYAHQLKTGEATKALATLRRVLAMEVAPKYLDYELARVHAKLGDYTAAWTSMRTYLQKHPSAY
jgi:tetratricopeptide (TPR) repeat protein